MSVVLIISLSLLSGIYLERGRKYVIRKIIERRWLKQKATLDQAVHSLSATLQELRKESDKRRQHAAEDCIKFPENPGESVTLPFAGGMCTITNLGEDSLEDQLQDALEHEEFERAAVLRDKMKER